MSGLVGQSAGPRRFADLGRRLDRIEADLRYGRSSRGTLRRGQFDRSSIPADALVSPTAPGVVAALATGFGVPAAPDGAVVLSATVLVPPLVTGCVVALTGRVYAVNASGAADYLTARVDVDTLLSTGLPKLVPAGAGDTNVAPVAVVLRDLVPGGLFRVRVWAAATAAAWAGDSGNTADLNGSLSWFA